MIDFHCHLDLYPDPHGVSRACIERGIYVLSVTTTPSAWTGTVALAEGATRIRTAIGLHPQLAHQRKGELAQLEELIGKTLYVGEIGLDGAPEFKRHWEDQAYVFKTALGMCQAVGGRVLSLHSRRAATAVLDFLEARPGAGLPILHWFSGTPRELARAVDLGCWFSVGPGMLRSDKGRELAKRMPQDRVLTESDGPFAQIDGRAVWPWEVELAGKELGALWGMTYPEVEHQLAANLVRLGKRALSYASG
ncbi:Qat anti-phage system TatD family nuclease QatD [Gemmobacter nectariphilus]|uniref:Qat anti-phage system TatD family nuclease QatD n=1 Tax=Gemmobacter nectariphilus TaxID=220343 RepID=UPI0004807723|nr:Qat anti-phage system TatD family nuclease QatD [Gemmobacter nectariphilus]